MFRKLDFFYEMLMDVVMWYNILGSDIIWGKF